MSSAKLRAVPGWNYLEYLLLRLCVAFVNALPVETASRMAAAAGGVLFYLMPGRRKVALANLEKAYPGPAQAAQREKIARETFRSVALSLMEFFRMPRMLTEAPARFEFEGTEILDAAFRRGRGIIFTISHLGSWEYLAFLPFLRGYPCSVVVRETRNPHIFPWIQALRAKTTLFPIFKKGAAREILRQLKQNHLAAILIDQWAGNDGIPADFFGHPTSVTPVPARLARRTGAALVPGYCLRTAPGRYRIVIRPEVESDVNDPDYERKTTEKLNRLLEEEIRKNPGQWTWGHKRWKGMEHFRQV